MQNGLGPALTNYLGIGGLLPLTSSTINQLGNLIGALTPAQISAISSSDITSSIITLKSLSNVAPDATLLALYNKTIYSINSGTVSSSSLTDLGSIAGN